MSKPLAYKLFKTNQSTRKIHKFSGGDPRIRKTLLKLLFHYKLGALFFSRYSKRGESPKGRKMLNSCVAHRRLSPSVPDSTCADSGPTWAPVWVLSRISLGVTD